MDWFPRGTILCVFKYVKVGKLVTNSREMTFNPCVVELDLTLFSFKEC
jgi:hypothetical protein